MTPTQLAALATIKNAVETLYPMCDEFSSNPPNDKGFVGQALSALDAVEHAWRDQLQAQ